MANKEKKQLLLVIKYYEKFALPVPGEQDRWTRWGIVNVNPDGKIHLKVVERSKAREVIRDNGLVESHASDTFGKVFDTPDKAFQKRYAGISVPYDIANRQ